MDTTTNIIWLISCLSCFINDIKCSQKQQQLRFCVFRDLVLNLPEAEVDRKKSCS